MQSHNVSAQFQNGDFGRNFRMATLLTESQQPIFPKFANHIFVGWLILGNFGELRSGVTKWEWFKIVEK
jgi:hypothetical protein